MRKWNFCAGPAVISEEVLSEVQSELLEFPNSGSSIMEMSHRSKTYMNVALDAKQDLRDILKIPENYEILFLQGGATHQFSMIPMNFNHLTGSADYITTGTWTTKAFIEGSNIMDLVHIFKRPLILLEANLLKSNNILLLLPLLLNLSLGLILHMNAE